MSAPTPTISSHMRGALCYLNPILEQLGSCLRQLLKLLIGSAIEPEQAILITWGAWVQQHISARTASLATKRKEKTTTKPVRVTDDCGEEEKKKKKKKKKKNNKKTLVYGRLLDVTPESSIAPVCLAFKIIVPPELNPSRPLPALELSTLRQLPARVA
ncbi:hypothetical protein Dda_2976 [Drechslerella dactyloides]|uniref:Uncharacterized protein n=1 Tax=Drechslerella dactyloides TaxID=74499 RepID=A0AAD6J4W3_DREDA|nr:hypothetical protein Dda_2976 [Drechslerella dactyloides]